MNSSGLSVCSLLLLGASPVIAQPAITGPALPGMQAFDAAVTGLMTKFNSPGAQLAVLRSGRLVLAHGYGLGDREAGLAMQPDSLMRVASMTKFVTAIAALTLVEQGKLDLEMKVFPFLGLLPLPGATTLDPRLQNITVRQLLHHTGGWDRDITPAYDDQTSLVSAAAGVTPPGDVDTVIRYYLGKPLDFDPGTRYAYANFGFMVLGRIIEKITGQSYVDYVKANVFSKAGITRAVSGRSLLADRQPGEVRYYDYPGAPLVRSNIPPTTALVPAPYGSKVMETHYASGGWVMTAVDYARLICAIDGSTPRAGILSAASINSLVERPAAPVSVGAVSYYAMGVLVSTSSGIGLRAHWYHNGGLRGTSSYWVRFSSGWTYVINFNTNPEGDPRYSGDATTDIAVAMNAAFAQVSPPAAGDLFLTALPDIVSAPVSQTVSPGSPATFSATFSSVTPQSYQWFKDGTVIAGATNSTLNLASVSAADAGVYRVVSTNAAGQRTSADATLTVPVVSTAGRLVNLSILAPLAAGEVMTMGTALGGAGTSGTKPLVTRAAGPSLAVFGVAGTLPDPRMALIAQVGGATVASNDDWMGDSILGNAFAQVGAFAYASSTSKDAGIFQSALVPGNYTVQVSDNSGGAGSVIAEIYDATPSSAFTAITPRLINVSVLKQIAAGTTLSAGFVIGGSTSRTVLVRAVGPTLGLAPFNIGGVMADPKLELFNNATGVKINENNDWATPVSPPTSNSAQLTATFTSVGAFQLANTATKDAALLVTLAPGQYSAQVGANDGGGGIAIVEIYEVP